MIEILTYIATFSPTVAAVAAIAIFCIWGLKQISTISKGFHDKTDDITNKSSQLISKVDEVIQSDAELKRVNSILVDKLTHIDGYIDEKLKERERNGKE